MTIVADLHIHTKASDGLLGPGEIMLLAAKKGLKALAITDHDTISAIDKSLFYGRQAGIKVFPGIEFSTIHDNTEIHILGYCFDIQDKNISRLLQQLQESRFIRMKKIVIQLQGLGFNISLDEVLKEAGGTAPGRPHVARLLVEKGYFKTIKEVFASLLEKGRPAYVERFKLTTREAIRAVRTAGGFTSWAHPGLSGKAGFFSDFLKFGLQGIEVSHPEHTAALEEYYRFLARDNGLIITGGSDYHGQNENKFRDLAVRGINEQELDIFMRSCRQFS